MNDEEIEKELEAVAEQGDEDGQEDDNNEEEIEKFFIDSAGLGQNQGIIPHVVDGELIEESDS